MTHAKLLWNYQNFKTYSTKPNLINKNVQDILELNQVHSNKIINIHRLQIRNKLLADGIYWEKHPKNLSLVIKTADCLPIGLLGEQNGAFLHCGWRPLNLGIIAQLQNYLSQLDTLIIGPSIGPCCFEVGPEVLECFPANFRVLGKNNQFNHLDLAQIAIHQALKYFPIKKIIHHHQCTCCAENKSDYPSYRRDKTTQRLWNILEF